MQQTIKRKRDDIGKVRVASYWHTEDVQSINEELTDEQAAAVLLLACVLEHNAELGVNWEVLSECAYWVRENPEAVARIVAENRSRLELSA